MYETTLTMLTHAVTGYLQRFRRQAFVHHVDTKLPETRLFDRYVSIGISQMAQTGGCLLCVQVSRKASDGTSKFGVQRWREGRDQGPKFRKFNESQVFPGLCPLTSASLFSTRSDLKHGVVFKFCERERQCGGSS